MFYPTWTDIGIYVGTIGLFFTFYLLYVRYFPVLAISEVKTILKSSGESYKNGSAPVHHPVVDTPAQEAAPVEEVSSDDTDNSGEDKSSKISSLIR